MRSSPAGLTLEAGLVYRVVCRITLSWGIQVNLDGGALSQLLGVGQEQLSLLLSGQILHDLNFDVVKVTFQTLLIFVVVRPRLFFAEAAAGWLRSDGRCHGGQPG